MEIRRSDVPPDQVDFEVEYVALLQLLDIDPVRLVVDEECAAFIDNQPAGDDMLTIASEGGSCGFL